MVHRLLLNVASISLHLSVRAIKTKAIVLLVKAIY
jgi:hypothetical protein